MPVFPANAALMSSTAFLSDAAAKTVTVLSCAVARDAPVNATAIDAAAAIMRATEFIGMAVLRLLQPCGRFLDDGEVGVFLDVDRPLEESELALHLDIGL